MQFGGITLTRSRPTSDNFVAFLLKAVLKSVLVTPTPTPSHTDHSPYLSQFTVLQVDSVFETFDQFFNLSPEVKAKYAKKKITVQNIIPQNGWDAVEVERFVNLIEIYSVCVLTMYLKIRNQPGEGAFYYKSCTQECAALVAMVFVLVWFESRSYFGIMSEIDKV